jgi:uncharacterized membrane protein
MDISLAFHLIGIVFWVGGLLVVTRFARLCVVKPADAEFAGTIKKTWLLYVIHGLAFTFISGFYQLFSGGIGTYMKQGWFHSKLTFVLVLFVATVMLGLQMRRIGSGEVVSAKALRWVQILTAFSFVIIVFMTKAFRF